MGCFSLTNPSSFAVHAVLIGVQVIFGIGAVVGKLGLPKTNPVLFAFVREASAGPILVLLAWYFERTLPRANKASFRFFATGLALFANQFCFIVGEKLANAVVGSAWQPTQPIFTAAISIAIGYERGFAAIKAQIPTYESVLRPPSHAATVPEHPKGTFIVIERGP